MPCPMRFGPLPRITTFWRGVGSASPDITSDMTQTHACELSNDRRAGARLGVHAFDVRTALTRYLRPQEAGSRTGVRWAEVMRMVREGELIDTKSLNAILYIETVHRRG